MLNWYLQSGNDSDVVKSTRIRFARNLNNIPFACKYTSEQAEEVIKLVSNAIKNLKYGLRIVKLRDLDDITKLSLIEKHLVSPEFAINKNNIGAIAINEDENICIMINEEDHMRIQILSAGLDLENLLNLGMEIDKELESLLEYAYSERYGFLTSCLSNVGTGLRASVMVHLPGLTYTRKYKKSIKGCKWI